MVQGSVGARLENQVALSLLKHQNFMEDARGRRCELQTLRTKEKKEVDFALVEDGRIEKIIEVKLSDAAISPSLSCFQQKYGFEAILLVKNLNVERMENSIQLRRAVNFLKELAV